MIIVWTCHLAAAQFSCRLASFDMCCWIAPNTISIIHYWRPLQAVTLMTHNGLWWVIVKRTYDNHKCCVTIIFIFRQFFDSKLQNTIKASFTQGRFAVTARHGPALVVLIYRFHIDIIDMGWHIQISICILNIAIFFDISLKIEKEVN